MQVACSLLICLFGVEYLAPSRGQNASFIWWRRPNSWKTGVQIRNCSLCLRLGLGDLPHQSWLGLHLSGRGWSGRLGQGLWVHPSTVIWRIDPRAYLENSMMVLEGSPWAWPRCGWTPSRRRRQGWAHGPLAIPWGRQPSGVTGARLLPASGDTVNFPPLPPHQTGGISLWSHQPALLPDATLLGSEAEFPAPEATWGVVGRGPGVEVGRLGTSQQVFIKDKPFWTFRDIREIEILL